MYSSDFSSTSEQLPVELMLQLSRKVSEANKLPTRVKWQILATGISFDTSVMPTIECSVLAGECTDKCKPLTM